jgi:crotonobetainyl-CoA:carnitine CoA-transferase CaiB-like acyl-CoA transferase
MPNKLPLAGLRVVDLADEKGELAGRILGDFGADVIRVEPPTGARSRQLGPFDSEGRSLYFAYRNSNKRGLALDLEGEADRGRLLGLLGRADVLIESEKPGQMADWGLSPTELSERFPHLIVLSISDFGQTGPYRDWVATDATMCAVSGMQFKAGTGSREPLFSPGAMCYDIAGIMGAYSVMVATYQRDRTGWGQAIDVSVLEAVAQQTDWSFSNGSMNEANGVDAPQTRVGSGPVYPIFPCREGYVRLVMMAPRQWHAMRKWLGEPDYLQDPKYDSFLGRMGIADALAVVVGDLFATMDHEEVSFEAQKRGIVCTPVLSPDEVIKNDHFQSRHTFIEAEYAKGASGLIPSGFFELDRERMGYRTRPPEIDEHASEIASDWSDLRPVPKGARPDASRPFEGLRVLDFGIGGVGVEAARFFADYGADVIKVESRTYPDFIRVVMSTEMSASFASSNRSKRAFGVNIKKKEGLALIHELAKHADVVTENGSTGMMSGMGVGYEELSKTNPKLVMASSQLLGDHGAWSNWIGYGPSTQPIGGLVYLWDYPEEGPPAGSTSIFPDHLAGRLLSMAALAGIIRRQRTGQGGHASVAQAEGVVNIVGDQMMKAALEPGSVKPRGNRNERGAPWGVYRCAGEDQWAAITVRNDDDWKRLCSAMGNPEWCQTEALETATGRFAAHDAIDEQINAWTAGHKKRTLAATLQMFGVPSAPMYTAEDQLRDPHYQARGFGHWFDQQGLGWMSFEGAAFHATGMEAINIFEAPLLGEHTREIARDVMGLDDTAIEKYISVGALEAPKN